MSLSSKARAVLKSALANKAVAAEVADQADLALATSNLALGSHKVVGVIVATATSTTTDFASLQIGDIVMKVPATPGTMAGGVVTVAGTSPLTPAIGDAFVVTRHV